MLEIELPVDFVADLSAQATQIVADLAPVWLLMGGILLGLGMIAFVVGLLAQSRTVNEVQEADVVDVDDELL